MKDVLDMHTHTYASGHAYSTLKEMIEAAKNKNLALLGVTEHAPSIDGTCSWLYFHNLRVVPRQYGSLELMLGAELNILNYEGKVDLENNTLKRIDYAIASLHNICIEPGTKEENTNALIKAMDIDKVKIIGHPDNGNYELDYEKLVLNAKEKNVLLELNNTSLNPKCSRKNARENIIKMLEYCKKYEAMVIMDSDAHIDVDVGDHLRIYPILEEMNFPENLVINTSSEKLKEFFSR